ncbi:DNA repair protein RAD16 [Coemansia sp. Benny D115]|nr:DNA repair protein RAD16 [Coemansia sp. Benny D115]
MPPPAPLLAFQRRILDDLLDEDALCIVARGLGLPRILGELARACATPQALVFLLNASDQDEEELQQLFLQVRSGEGVDQPAQLRVVANETNAAARAQLYRRGGLVSVTSRILIVDLLNGVAPTELITGLIVCNASRITAESTEAFILRIVRQRNNAAFVKALSDAPEAFTLGFAPLEKTLKALGLRHVHLWPRFHVDVQRDLAAASAPVVELRQPQTRAMVELQQAALDCVSATISELCAAAKMLDTDTVSVEASLFRHFDAVVKRQLAPYWHRLSARVRGMVGELAALRSVGELITAADCVSLQRYLDALLLANKPSGRPGAPGPAAWLASDSANILYAVARARLFRRPAADSPLPEEARAQLRRLGLPDNIVPVLEAPPKLPLLRHVLDEIGAANHRPEAVQGGAGPVLIMAASPRECRLIRAWLTQGDLVNVGVAADDSDGSSDRHPRVMVDLLRGFFRWKAAMATSKPANGPAAPPRTGARPAAAPRAHQGTARNAPPTKRRRVRGASTAASAVLRAPADALESESAALAAGVNEQSTALADPEFLDGYGDDDDDALLGTFDANFGVLSERETVVVQTYGAGDDVLATVRPTHVVMYDPDAAFVREIEVYQARGGRLRQVYLMVYDNSIEEQRYLSAIRRERESFERLISNKASMVIPLSTAPAASPAGSLLLSSMRSARSAREPTLPGEAAPRPSVVVDVREFRAPLPSLLHAAGFDVVPRTIDVGDYVLHDGLVVERKSLPDLVGSLRSGRLYNQAEAMTRHYAHAALLIEFEPNSSFSLQALGGLSADIQFGAIGSQLAMLVLAFPRLRILWSSSPYETVSIFAELKRGMDEPDAERAVAAGQDDAAVEREAAYAAAPIALLQALPGVTLRNYQALASRFASMRELCAASVDDLGAVLDGEAARKLHSFLNAPAAP